MVKYNTHKFNITIITNQTKRAYLLYVHPNQKVTIVLHGLPIGGFRNEKNFMMIGVDLAVLSFTSPLPYTFLMEILLFSQSLPEYHSKSYRWIRLIDNKLFNQNDII